MGTSKEEVIGILSEYQGTLTEKYFTEEQFKYLLKAIEAFEQPPPSDTAKHPRTLR